MPIPRPGYDPRVTPRSRSTDGALRYIDIGRYQDTFLIFAVATIIVIRLELWYTNYPQVGGGGLHIAHLLYGGALMVVVIALLLSFLGRRWRMPSAILGGIGFGLFIDELGKFITEDNDYFFKPAAAVIYMIFIVLFLITRAMQNRRGLTPREYLVNAIDILAEAARRDLDEHQRRRALDMLERADPDDPLVAPARRLLHEIEAAPAPEPRFYTRWALAARERYFGLVDTSWFPRVIGGVFVLWAVFSAIEIVVLVVLAGFALEGVADAPVRFSDLLDTDTPAFVSIASIAASVAVGVLVIAGVLRLRAAKRLTAYRLFERAMLVQIFVADFFSFVESEFSAVFGLAVDVLLLITVRFLIRRERELPERGVDTAQPSRPRAVAAAEPA
jgi:hypothetical protein